MVWQNEEVGNFVNKTFVSLRVVSRDKAYSQYRENYKLQGFPTVLFLDAQGKEIDRICGFDDDKNQYFQILKDFAAGKNTIADILAQAENNPNDSDINYKLAKKYMSRWEDNQAVASFAKVLELDPDDTKGYKTEATYEIALNEARAKKNPEPLQKFVDTNTVEKYIEGSYINLASTYFRLKNKEKGSAVFEEALIILPDSARIRLIYADLIFGNKVENLYQKGMELLDKAVAMDPEQEISKYYILAQYYINIKDKDKLSENFETALRKFPDNLGLVSYYVMMINRQKIEGKYDRGIGLAQKVLEGDPESASTWNTLGSLYHKKGDLDNAIEATRKALSINPDNKSYQNALERLEAEKNK